jgi:hypothetical protein
MLKSILFIILFKTLLCANPIVHFEQGYDERAELVIAKIQYMDFDCGTSTSKNQKLAREIRSKGVPSDVCGHIVAKKLGGPMEKHNLFPQDADANRRKYLYEFEYHVITFLKQYKDPENFVEIAYSLEYNSKTDTRPISLNVYAEFNINGTLASVDDIPPFGSHVITTNPYYYTVYNPLPNLPTTNPTSTTTTTTISSTTIH